MVSEMANYLNSYSPSDILIYDYAYDDYDEEYIKQVASEVMNTSNAFYVLCSNKLFKDGENI